MLGAGSAAVPVQAQEGPSFNVNLELPGEQGSITSGQGGGHRGPRYNGGGYDDDYNYLCPSDREVRRGISAYGYSRVELRRDLPRQRVEVVGQYGNWLYSMRVDRCIGGVDRTERIRRVRGGGFGVQFGN